MLLNIGFLEALKVQRWDCIIFHDVDLLPESDLNLYHCPKTPRHFSVGQVRFHVDPPGVSQGRVCAIGQITVSAP